MPRKKKSARRVRVTTHLDNPALDLLREDLSSPRLAPAGTLKTYMQTAERFLRWTPNTPPTASDFRQYFIKRRQQNISEKTLRKEFYQLKRLASANTWEWPFTSRNVPEVTEEEEERLLPALFPEQVRSLIAARDTLNERERFYLAVATTWIVRREDLSRIVKRDFDDTTLTIHHSKKGKTVKHLIPDVLHPVFDAFRPHEHNADSLTDMFQRICRKAGIERKPRVGWHSIRYALTTALNSTLAKNDLEPILLAEYGGWKKKSMAHIYGGVEMAARYQRPEILYTDQFGVDKVIYSVHPFLRDWESRELTKLSTKRNRKPELTVSPTS